jgi:hypothetical protein
MDTSPVTAMPLIGALFVTEGLISQAQLETCLALQAQHYPATPIGQILLQQGYVAEAEVARMVARQRALRRKLATAVEHQLAKLVTSDVERQIAPAATPTAPRAQAIPELAELADGDIENACVFDGRY